MDSSIQRLIGAMGKIGSASFNAWTEQMAQYTCKLRWASTPTTVQALNPGSTRTAQGQPMPRPLLDEAAIHPAIRHKVANLHAELLRQAQADVASNTVMVFGMSGNPWVGTARKALNAADVPHGYLEIGSYFSQWRRRNALKMWTGWPTFPMVFVRGVLVGGAEDVARLIETGELKQLLSA